MFIHFQSRPEIFIIKNHFNSREIWRERERDWDKERERAVSLGMLQKPN